MSDKYKYRSVIVTEETGVTIGRTHYAPGPHTPPLWIADLMLDEGWAKDAETGVQGERRPGARPLVVDDSVGTGAN